MGNIRLTRRDAEEEPEGETVNIPFNEYVENLESEGMFAYEQLSDYESESESITEEKREEKEEYLQSRGGELAADISSMFDIERGSDDKYYFEGEFISESCCCSEGITCRWSLSSPYYNSIKREVEDTSSRLLGLCWWETWGLPCDKISEEGVRLRYEGRQGSNDLWDCPEYLLRIEEVKVRYCCRDDSIVLFASTNNSSDAWLCHVKLDENDRFQIVCYKCVLYEVVASPGHADKVRWGSREYYIYHRMAKWKFAYLETFQATSIVDLWSTEYLENKSPDQVKRILACVPGSIRRGFLRYI